MTKVNDAIGGPDTTHARSAHVETRRPTSAGHLGGCDVWAESVTVKNLGPLPWSGAQVRTAKDADCTGMALTMGVVVTKVDPDSPAAKSGIKEGDVITNVDVMAVWTLDKFNKMIGTKTPGDTLELWVRRNHENPNDSENLSVSLTLGRAEAKPTLSNVGPQNDARASASGHSAPLSSDRPAQKPISVRTLIDDTLRLGDKNRERHDHAIAALQTWVAAIGTDDRVLPQKGTIARFAAEQLIRAINEGDWVTAHAIKNAHPKLAALLSGAPHERVDQTISAHPSAPPAEARQGESASTKPPAALSPGIGVKLASITREIADKISPDKERDAALELPIRDSLARGRGAFVDEMPDPDSMAAKTGFQFGDVIVRVGGMHGGPVRTPDDVARMVHAMAPGESAFVYVWRNGQEVNFWLTREGQPSGA